MKIIPSKIRQTIVHRLRRSVFYPTPGPNYMQWLLFWRTLRTLPTQNFHRVLDAGVGMGHYAVTFAERFPHCQVTGYDLSDSYKLGWGANPPSNLLLKTQDLKTITERDQYQLIYSIEVLEHIPGNEQVISSLARALAPSGYLFLHLPYETDDRWIFPKKWFRRYQEWAAREHIGRMYTPDELAAVVRKQGLEIVDACWTAGRTGQLLGEFDEIFRYFPRWTKLLRLFAIPFYKPFAWWGSRHRHNTGSVMVLAQKPDVAPQVQTTPLISVLMATYKSERFIERSLRSVLNQTYSNLEVIIIDEGPRDRTEEIVNSFNDPRIQFYHDDDNTGLSGARNKGIRRSTGTLLSFLDADDVWHPDKTTKQLALFQKNSTLGVAYCGIRYFTDHGVLGTRLPCHRGNVLEPLLGENAIGNASTVMIHKDCFEAAGIFEESLRMFAEDQELFIRIAEQYNFDFVPEALVDYYIHTANKTGGLQAKPTRTISDRLSIYKQHKQVYDRFPKSRGKFFRRIGLQYVREGRGSEARPYLCKSLQSRPLDPKTWSVILLSFTNKHVANFAFDFSNRIHRVHHHAVPPNTVGADS